MRKRMTRRDAQQWLAPIRRALMEVRSGEVDSIQGYAVTRLHARDNYSRLDYCINGFTALLARLAPDISMAPADRVSKKLGAGVPLTIAEVDAVLVLLNQCEKRLVGMLTQTVKDAVLVEMVNIELEALGLKEAA